MIEHLTIWNFLQKYTVFISTFFAIDNHKVKHRT